MCVVAMFLEAASKVVEPDRDELAERNLERAARGVDVAVAARRRMQVDAVRADADRVLECDRAVGAARVECDVRLDDRGLAPDAPRLAHVERRGEPILRVADDVAAQPQAGPAGAAVV